MAEKKSTEITAFSLDNPSSLEQLATKLGEHIKKNNLCKQIGDKIYVNVEGWQYAGGHLGIVPIITETKDLSKDKVYKYWAKCELRNVHNGMVVGQGEAICTNLEARKVKFDEYAVFSMAQTRAIGKAFRSLLGWLMKVAGYESTPAEEMDNGESADASDIEHYQSDLPPIPKYDEANRKWLDEGTAEYYEAVALLTHGYTVKDLFNRWKINKRTTATLEDLASRIIAEEAALQTWRDTLGQIDNLADLDAMFESEKQRFEGDDAIHALFEDRRKEIRLLTQNQ